MTGGKTLGVLLLYTATIVAFCWAMLAMAAHAQDSKLVLVVKGDSAPFSGLLLSEMRYTELKAAEFELENTNLKLKIEQQANADLKTVADACIAELEESGPWYTSFWAGAVVGIGLAVAVGWLGAEAEWW